MSARARPWLPSWIGWRPCRGNSSGPRPARPDQAAHRRLRRCDRVLLPVGVSHHHPVAPRTPNRHHRCARVLSPTRGAPRPGVGDGRSGDDRGAARSSFDQRPQRRTDLRTRRRSCCICDQPLRLVRPLFRYQDYFNYTWSLSIEEQFYLLWPFALLWGYRRNPRLFAALTGSFIGITPGDQPLPRPESRGDLRSRTSTSGATRMRCPSWSAHCSRLLSTTVGCPGRFDILRPVRC